MIIRGEPIGTYHANPAVSNSKLKDFRARGPAYYRRAYVDREIRRPPSKALIDGQAFDTLLFDGEEAWDAAFAIRPDTYQDAKGVSKRWNGNANACKEWVAEVRESGREVVSSEDWDLYQSMLKAIQRNELAMLLLGRGEHQVTLRRESPRFGLAIQSRPDWLSLDPCRLSGGLPYVVDLKTTRDFGDWFDEFDPGSPLNGKPVFYFGYHRQMALAQYLAAQEEEIGRTAHFLLVVEKQEPFRVGIVQLSEEYLEMGWESVARDLERLKRCHAKDEWPSGPTGVVQLRPQGWMTEQNDRESRAS